MPFNKNNAEHVQIVTDAAIQHWANCGQGSISNAIKESLADEDIKCTEDAILLGLANLRKHIGK